MSIHSETAGLLIVARPESAAARLGKLLAGSLDPAVATRAAIVDASAVGRYAPLDALTDADFEQGVVQALIDFAGDVARTIETRDRILLVGTTEHLGDWHNAVAASHDAAVIGLMRSLVLEHLQRRLSINILSLRGDDPTGDDAVGLAASLLTTSGVSGQVLVVDGGNSLRLARAQPRTATHDA